MARHAPMSVLGNMQITNLNRGIPLPLAITTRISGLRTPPDHPTSQDIWPCHHTSAEYLYTTRAHVMDNGYYT